MSGLAEFDSKVIVAFWGLVTLLLVWIIWRRGRRRQPSLLRLRSEPSGRQPVSTSSAQFHSQGPVRRRQTTSQSEASSAKQLNLLFQWQGSMYDAYQVLLLPAGSSMEKVVSAYDQLLEKCADEAARDLLREAYLTITKNAKSI